MAHWDREREMFPVFTRHDLINLPNWHAYMTTLINGKVVRPFNLQPVLSPVPNDDVRVQQVQERSRQKYGRARPQVEQEIQASLQEIL